MSWAIEESSLGRIVVAPALPSGAVLFYTTADFPGQLDDASTGEIKRLLRDRFGIDSSLATCHQTHGASAIRVEGGRDRWCEFDGCDALWSVEPHISLGIKVADCLPVTLIDRSSSLIANIHSGGRGAAAGITAATIANIADGSTFDPSETSAWLGPSIRRCCFEVGEEVVQQFANAERYTDRTLGDRPHLDLAAITRDVLEVAGLHADSIHDSALCTRCEGSIFHSYRRNGRSAGRNLAVVAQ
jgi:YfiH family protein